MEDLTTVDSILLWIQDTVKKNLPIDSHTWVRGCLKIVSLMDGEHEKLFDLQQKVAELKCLILESNESVAKAKVMVEKTDEYKNFCKQKARIERIWEMVRLAKIQSKLVSEEMKGYN